MADVARSEQPPRLTVTQTWRRLGPEQRAAAVGALLLMVSTIGPFSFVEGAILVIGGGILLMLRKRAEGRLFHIPFGDGTIIAAAGVWAGILIFIRLLDRPLGQGLLALACAAILIVAGLRERAKRPADDIATPVPEPPRRTPTQPGIDPWEPAPVDRSRYRDETVRLEDGKQPPPADRPKPAKVLPPMPRPDDLEDPPAWKDPRRPKQT
jgi:hypothetical protein